jgi:DNA-binding NarL/FixJ family response regulator
VIRLVIADDQVLVRDGFCSILNREPDMEVVAEAADGAQAVAAVTSTRPDVALLDVRMPVMDGVQAAGALAEHARVMMLTYTDEQEQVVAAIRAGASGYLVHGQFGSEELVERIRQLAAGETVLSPAIVGTVFEALRRTPGSPDGADGPASLTAREREIMNLISQGLTNGQIAERFVLSEKTVKNHVNRIYGKLGATNRAQATALWLGTAPRPGV